PPDLFDKLKPEFVAPLVLYLCSQRCNESGMIFNAGMGYYNRAALVTGPGTVISDGSKVPAPEEIHVHWAAINELSGSREFPTATAALGFMMEALGPKKQERAPEADGRLTVPEVFARIPQAFQAEK
ncbi:MAG: short-chain dehydrogenase, partial [Proteobacteria bacterium]|nr:short-chain dehydrogenase [Pseudomonadota bacterium]NIS71540.1 short-chain dehydrogenase [Pseudomonadota bacterium]